MRESIFAMVGSRSQVEGATVADLFAGSGALGIEALSRGAASVVFVESAAGAAEVVRANLGSLALEGGTVVVSDVLRYLGDGRSFDLVFADPPYAWDRWDELLAAVTAGLFVAESNREIVAGGRWRVLKVSRYRDTVVTLLTAASPPLSKGSK